MTGYLLFCARSRYLRREGIDKEETNLMCINTYLPTSTRSRKARGQLTKIEIPGLDLSVSLFQADNEPQYRFQIMGGNSDFFPILGNMGVCRGRKESFVLRTIRISNKQWFTRICGYDPFNERIQKSLATRGIDASYLLGRSPGGFIGQ